MVLQERIDNANLGSHISGAIRPLRLYKKIAMPISLRRVTNILNTDAMLFQAFTHRFSRYGDKTLTLFADGEAVEVPVFI
jgi:hypothetical protein